MGKKLKKGGTRNTDEAQNNIKTEKKVEIQHTEDIRGLDERSMIREQDRLAREKKKRKNSKKKRIGSAVVLVILAGGVWYFFWGRNLLVREEETSVQITASAGQEIQYARLTGIKGNEITYTLAEALETDGNINNDGVAVGENGGEMPDMGGGMPSGGMPDFSGDLEAGEIPDMSQMDGNTMFEGRNGSFGGRGGQGGSTNTFTYDGVTYQLTDETITAQIPVGTDVTTKLGTVTTFSRLASGDCVALVTEKAGEERIIVAVYIIG